MILAYYQSGFYGISTFYWMILGGSMLASMLVSGMLKRRFAEYSQIPMPLSGAEVAARMLHQNGINDVRVISVDGQLTDHYDPVSKTVNLSEAVYGSYSLAAAAVAAHECGHAVQHQKAYVWLGLRSMMVLGFVGMSVFRSTSMLWVWVALFAVTTVFSIVTLPVEFDASRRALVWLESSGLAVRMEHDRAKSALFWAAMTYVVAAIGSIAQLLYFLMLAMGGRRD